MVTKLLQVKIDPKLKTNLEEIAEYKGISVTSFVKLTLTEVTRKEKKQMYTENGLTEETEQEILHREKEMIEDYKKGKIKPKTAKVLIKELNA